MKARIRKRHFRKDILPGFQIAPMIDVVFVILLFFMVAAGTRTKENANEMELPGDEATVISLPDEVVIGIASDGQVYLNDNPVDAAGEKNLNELAGEMANLVKLSKESGARFLVTIRPEETVKYDRVTDVLDALARAGVKGVTFDVVAEP